MNELEAKKFAAVVVDGFAEWVELNPSKARMTYYNRAQNVARVFGDTARVAPREAALVFNGVMHSVYSLSNEFEEQSELLSRLRDLAVDIAG